MGITPAGNTGRYSIARTSMPIARHHYYGSPLPRLRPLRRDPPPRPPPRRRRRRDRPAAQDTRGGTRGADLDVSRTLKVSAAAATLHQVAPRREDRAAHDAEKLSERGARLSCRDDIINV